MPRQSSADDLRNGLESGRFVQVANFGDEFEAELVGRALDELRIDHVIRSAEETAFSFLFADGGWGVLLVRSEDAAEARRVVDDLRASDAAAAAQVQGEFDA